MALSFDASPLRDFLDNLAGGASPADWLWQLGVGATGLALGWYAARVVCAHIKPNPRWKFGAGGFEQVAFPVLAWVFVALGKLILERFQVVALMQIMLTLLLALAVIRIAAYVLGHVLPQGSFLRASIRLIAWIAWIAVALHLTGVLPDVIEALQDVGFSLGKDQQRVTLWLVLQALGALALTLTLAAWIARVTESRVLAAEHVEMSTRIVITKLVRVATMFIAILVALPLVGIDVTTLSIFSGALGVGLGFGLQKIASNYVSGFIVLLDRSLRLGDLITVDGRKGNVKSIASRYTVIKSGDGSESIIPNEKLITESVYHHTFSTVSDPKAAVVLGVTVAYDSDVELACRILVEAARAQKRAIAEPQAVARVKLLGESGIDLELVCWIADPALGDADLKSDIFKAVLEAFREAGIEIPYPRRDLRVLATAETRQTPFKTES
jgi:small-conductance mechanosensitive channel